RRPELRMALQAAVQLPERHELLDREEAPLREGGVPHGARVSFAQNESIAVGPRGVLRVDAEDVKIEGRHDVASAHRAAGMAALHVVRHADDVLTEGHGLPLQGRDEFLRNLDHGPPRPRSVPGLSRQDAPGLRTSLAARASRNSTSAHHQDERDDDDHDEEADAAEYEDD